MPSVPLLSSPSCTPVSLPPRTTMVAVSMTITNPTNDSLNITPEHPALTRCRRRTVRVGKAPSTTRAVRAPQLIANPHRKRMTRILGSLNMTHQSVRIFGRLNTNHLRAQVQWHGSQCRNSRWHHKRRTTRIPGSLNMTHQSVRIHGSHNMTRLRVQAQCHGSLCHSSLWYHNRCTTRIPDYLNMTRQPVRIPGSLSTTHLGAQRRGNPCRHSR